MNQKQKTKRNAPYVSAAALSGFLDHIRYVSTPKKVGAGLLGDYGVSKGNTFALISALKFLGLIDNAGNPTPAFSSLQTMGEEFRSNLQEIVKKAYADLFSKLDVTKDSREHIRNYFSRNYSASQAEKATILFLDVCREAGIPTLGEKLPRVAKPEPAPSKPRVRTGATELSEQEEARVASGEPEVQGQPHINIRIDSKDFASMQAEQIQAFFNGLSKIMKREEEADK